MTDSCLILIDMQNGVFKLKDGVYNAEAIIKNTEHCIKAALHKNMKVVMTQHENNSFLCKYSDEWDIIKDIKTYSHKSFMLEKRHPSIYQDTNLKNFLQKNDIITVYICGLISNGCIKDACLESFQLGFNVYLIDDCHSTVYKNAQKVISDVNKQMNEAGIKLISAASFGEN